MTGVALMFVCAAGVFAFAAALLVACEKIARDDAGRSEDVEALAPPRPRLAARHPSARADGPHSRK